MKKLLKAYKVEIKPTLKQIQKINQSIDVCRWLYNEYLAINNQLYAQFKEGLIDKKQAFMGANDFDKYINNEVKVLDEYSWINNCGSKARKKAIQNAKIESEQEALLNKLNSELELTLAEAEEIAVKIDNINSVRDNSL